MMAQTVQLRSKLMRAIHGSSLSPLFMVTLVTAVFVVGDSQVPLHAPMKETEISQLEKYSIIPNYLSMPPDYRLTVTYPTCTINFGNRVSEKSLKPIPKVYWDAQENDYYSLIMINPDKLNKEPLPVEYLQWLVVNIKGNNISTGQPIFKYEAPKAIEPFPRFHTFVFLLYHQDEGIVHVDRSYAASGRRKEKIRVAFRINKFIVQHHLHEPWAVNFCRVKNPRNKNEDFFLGF